MIDPAPTGSADGDLEQPEIERAEQMVDDLTRSVTMAASQASLWILRTVARAREEAEDIWAEAQSLRDQDQS